MGRMDKKKGEWLCNVTKSLINILDIVVWLLFGLKNTINKLQT